MAQLTRLSLVVTLCLLGSVGVGQVPPSGQATSAATRYRDPAKVKVVVLACSSAGLQTFTVKRTVDTVIFVTFEECPLNPDLSFDQDILKPLGPDSDGNNLVYGYTGTSIKTPLHFKYSTGGPGAKGGGTGVIKN